MDWWNSGADGDWATLLSSLSFINLFRVHHGTILTRSVTILTKIGQNWIRKRLDPDLTKLSIPLGKPEAKWEMSDWSYVISPSLIGCLIRVFSLVSATLCWCQFLINSFSFDFIILSSSFVISFTFRITYSGLSRLLLSTMNCGRSKPK